MKIYKDRSGGSIVNLLICIAIAYLSGLSCGHRQGEGIEIMELKCEYSDNPLGIENNNPKLSWILHSYIRNQKQSSICKE
jgi:alpha-L-rhamnosidase